MNPTSAKDCEFSTMKKKYFESPQSLFYESFKADNLSVSFPGYRSADPGPGMQGCGPGSRDTGVRTRDAGMRTRVPGCRDADPGPL